MTDDEDHWLADLVEATERAVAPIRSDLERTYELDVSIRITVEDGHPRVWVSDGSSDGYANGPLPEDDEAAKADMADYVQEQLMDENVSSFWPTCGEHHRGLHAEVHEGAAVWFCREGNHSVAAIGQLVGECVGIPAEHGGASPHLVGRHTTPALLRRDWWELDDLGSSPKAVACCRRKF